MAGMPFGCFGHCFLCLTGKDAARKQRALFLRPILRIVVPDTGTARFVMRGFYQQGSKT
jgi:hypothetical protein